MALTQEAADLLKLLVQQGDRGCQKVGKNAFAELQGKGFAKRNSSHGKVRITRRGILKALAEKWIEKHPDDREPMLVALGRLREHQRLVEKWGPGR